MCAWCLLSIVANNSEASWQQKINEQCWGWKSKIIFLVTFVLCCQPTLSPHSWMLHLKSLFRGGGFKRLSCLSKASFGLSVWCFFLFRLNMCCDLFYLCWIQIVFFYLRWTYIVYIVMQRQSDVMVQLSISALSCSSSLLRVNR